MSKVNNLKVEFVKEVNNSVDYKEVELIETGHNRKLTNAHVKNIMDNISLMGFIGTLIVLKTKAFGKLQYLIVDGQNRYTACMRLMVPYNYKVYKLRHDTPENVTKLIAKLNTGQKAWSPDNYLDAFVANGLPNYIKMKKVKEETGLTCTDLQHIYLGGGGKNEVSIWKSGEMEFFDEERCDLLKDAVMLVKNVVPKKAFVRRKLIAKFKMCKDFMEFAAEVREAGEHLKKGKGSMPQDEKEFERYIDELYKDYKAESKKNKAA